MRYRSALKMVGQNFFASLSALCDGEETENQCVSSHAPILAVGPYQHLRERHLVSFRERQEEDKTKEWLVAILLLL